MLSKLTSPSTNATSLSIQSLLQACQDLQPHSDEHLLECIAGHTSCLSDIEKQKYITTLRLFLQSSTILHQPPQVIGEDQGIESQQEHEGTRDLSILSPRELEILPLLARGYTLPQIGEELFISPATVNNHCSRMREKLGLRGRNALMTFAISQATMYTH